MPTDGLIVRGYFPPKYHKKNRTISRVISITLHTVERPQSLLTGMLLRSSETGK